MLIRNLKASNHVLYVTVFCASKLMPCLIWNATHVIIDSIALVYTNGLSHQVKTNVSYVNNRGVERKLANRSEEGFEIDVVVVCLKLHNIQMSFNQL